ncbi:MAG: hypothetical protein ACUVWP_04145 [bacterium]
MYIVANYINIDADHIYSAYDSGIISYFTNGKVLSIDGNINFGAYKAFRDRKIYNYMVDNNVDYLVGKSEWTKFICEPFSPYPFDEIFTRVYENDNDLRYQFIFNDFAVFKLNKIPNIK